MFAPSPSPGTLAMRSVSAFAGPSRRMLTSVEMSRATGIANVRNQREPHLLA
jgi:hypothetical protein